MSKYEASELWCLLYWFEQEVAFLQCIVGREIIQKMLKILNLMLFNIVDYFFNCID